MRATEKTARRCCAYCVNLTESQSAQILEKAKAERRAPSELIYFIVSDFLTGLIK